MKKIINFFSKYKLSLAGKKIILAISAGPDSMALLDMMRQIVDDPQSQLIICHVDHCLSCLLYTSPSPRDRTRSRMPSSA